MIYQDIFYKKYIYNKNNILYAYMIRVCHIMHHLIHLSSTPIIIMQYYSIYIYLFLSQEDCLKRTLIKKK